MGHKLSAIVTNKMNRILRKIASKAERLTNRTILQETHDAKALQRLGLYMDDYLPWTGSALRPSAISMIYNEIIIHQRSRVLEIGCGMSTVMLSRFLAERGGTLVSLENDQGWIDVTQKNLGNGAEVCELVHAELIEQEISGQKYMWYDLERGEAKTHLTHKPFDVLIVDAPISTVGAKARFPALHKLRDYMADDFVVFLDDIERDDETEIAKEWCAEFNLDYKKSGVIGGLGIMRPKNSPNQYNIC